MSVAMVRLSMRGGLLLALVSTILTLCASGVAHASSEGVGWELSATTYPTNIKPTGIDEVQEVTPEATTFTLSYENATTASLAQEASAATIQSALEALPTIGAGDVSVSRPVASGPATVTFVANLGNMAVARLEATGASTSVTTLGAASGTIEVMVFNIGAEGTRGQVTVTDHLPPGVRARAAGYLLSPGYFGIDFGVDPEISSAIWACTGNGTGPAPKVAGATVVTCQLKEEELELKEVVSQENGVRKTEFEKRDGLWSIAGGGGVPEFQPYGAPTPPPSEIQEGILQAEPFNAEPSIGITVEAEDGTPEGTRSGEEANEATIEGGGAVAPATTTDPVTISTSPAKGGLARADAWLSNADGTIDRQAGSHPYAATFVFTAATAIDANNQGYMPGGGVRDFENEMPAGLVGDLRELPQCERPLLKQEKCPADSMVGRLMVELLGFGSAPLQVFNMKPEPGEPAELGFFYESDNYITFSVKTGGNNAIVAHVKNITENSEPFTSALTLWGAPSEPSHDIWRYGNAGCSRAQMQRGAEIDHRPNYCRTPPTSPLHPTILRSPTSCEGEPRFAFRELSSWGDAEQHSEVSVPVHDAQGNPVGFDGCGALAFEPAFALVLSSPASDSPSALTAEVKAPTPAENRPEILTPADLKDATIMLPAGVAVNPGQASGLQACNAVQSALTTSAEAAEGKEDAGPPTCPATSRLGSVVIKTPLLEAALEKQLEGGVYLLESNPPEIRLLVAASADGVNLKLVGVASLCESAGQELDGKQCEAPGQIVTRFTNAPQTPFSSFKLTFAGGPHADLTTPTGCGAYSASADFSTWANPFVPDFFTNAGFTVNEGPGGSACPQSHLPFAPSMHAGATSDRGGAFTGFSLDIARGDGQQRLERLSVTTPAGLAALIANVPTCPEPAAAQGTCAAGSRIGHVAVASGPGGYPLALPQPGEPELPIYLTGPYDGAPFGLSIVTPVIAGPFNLGTIVTRARIEIDPRTAQVTIISDPLPQMLKGVPTDVRSIDAVIDREDFMFNPTSCAAQNVSATAWGIAPPGVSEAGQTASLTSGFGLGSCRELAFTPTVSTTTPAHASHLNGTSLSFKIAYPKGAMGKQAWFNEAKFELPKQLSARLSTLQKACLQHVFEVERQNCPAAARIGTAVVHTPVLPVPLEGKVYFVSYGGAKFPEAVIDLYGDNVHVELHGETFISKQNITSATFRNTPDVPFESIEVTLPAGPFSEFAANLPHESENFCGRHLTMGTLLKGQNGLEIKQSTTVAVKGCPKPKSKKQRLAAALKACRRKHGHSRSVCEAAARRKYA